MLQHGEQRQDEVRLSLRAAWAHSGTGRRFSANSLILRRLCQRWQQGHCRFGDRCNFAHGHQELRRPPGGARSDASRLYGQVSTEQALEAGRLVHTPGLKLCCSQLGTGIGALPGYQGGMAPNFGMGAFPELQRQQVPPAGPFPGQPDLLGLQSSLQNPAFVGLGSANDNEMWIRQGRPVPGPPGWTAYTTEQGEVYYHHAPTNSTTWERPLEWP